MGPSKLLRRKAASEYLRDAHGLERAPATLAKLAVTAAGQSSGASAAFHSMHHATLTTGSRRSSAHECNRHRMLRRRTQRSIKQPSASVSTRSQLRKRKLSNARAQATRRRQWKPRMQSPPRSPIPAMLSTRAPPPPAAYACAASRSSSLPTLARHS